MELATKRPSDMDQFSYVEPIGHNGSRPVSTAPVTGTVDAHAVWPRGCGRARPGGRVADTQRRSGGRRDADHSERAPVNDSANQPVPLPAIQFMKVTEVASMLRVSRMSVYRLIHAGELEAVRFGRNFRVPEQAVNNYLQQSFYNAG